MCLLHLSPNALENGYNMTSVLMCPSEIRGLNLPISLNRGKYMVYHSGQMSPLTEHPHIE